MADNFDLPAAGIKGASDVINGIHHQRIKMQFGVDGQATDVSPTDPLPTTVPSPDTVRTRIVYAAGATPIWTPTDSFQLMRYTLTLPTGAQFTRPGAFAQVVQLRDGANGPVLAEHILQPADDQGVNTTGWIDLGGGLRSAQPGQPLHIHLSEDLDDQGDGPRGVHVMVMGIDTVTGAPTPAGYPYGLPTVTGVTPTTWDGGGTTEVTVTGTNLFEPSAELGGAYGTGCTTTSDYTEFTFMSPVTDTVVNAPLTIGNPYGTVLADDQITVTGPDITDYQPDHSPASGGQAVTIIGTDLDGTTEITWADTGTAFTAITVAPDGLSLTAATPPHPPSSNPNDRVGLRLIATAGAARAYSAYLIYGVTPTILSLTPASGPAGTAIDGTGSYFAAEPYTGNWTVTLVDTTTTAEVAVGGLTIDDATDTFTFTIPGGTPTGTYDLRVDCDAPDGPQIIQVGVGLTVT